MSMTPVPISIRLVRAPTAASSGNGEASWRAKWWTRKYAPSAPSSSDATASSIDCSSASDADRVCDPGDADQCPNDRNPIFFMPQLTRGTAGTFRAAPEGHGEVEHPGVAALAADLHRVGAGEAPDVALGHLPVEAHRRPAVVVAGELEDPDDAPDV